jgi:threonine dehydrogenase-like Zn-dependent dehydrogenase
MTTLQTPAFLLERDLSMRIDSRSLPEPGPEDAVIRVRWAGLCGSDLHVMRTGAWVREWPARSPELSGALSIVP